MQPRLAFLNQTPHQQLPLLRQLLVVAVLTLSMAAIWMICCLVMRELTSCQDLVATT